MSELDGAVLETPEVEAPAESTDITEVEETPDVEAEPEADSEPAEGEEPEVEGEEQEPVAADGRRMPDSLKKGLAALKAVAPDAAKELRGIYFANQEYRNAFPTVADATQAKTLIEEIGGPEGVQQIAQEREEWGTLDKQYAEGSGDFVKSIAESNPDAFVKIAPHAINEWASRAPEQYQYFAQSLTVNMLKNAGIPDQLASAYNAASDNPQLQAQIAGVYNAIVDMHEKSQQFATKQQSVDPERQKLQQEKQQWETQRRASFEEGVYTQAKSYLTSKMDGAIKIVAANRAVDPEALPHYHNLINAEIEKRMAAITGFEAKLEGFYRTGNAAESLKFIQNQYDKLLPEAAKVIAPLVRNLGPAQAAPAKKAPPASNGSAVRSEVTLKEMPNWSDIDMEKTRQEYGDPTAAVMSGKAILKSGKKASGWI